MDATGNQIIDGNNFIRHHLKHNKLFAAGKIGVTEGKILYYYSTTGKSEEHSLHEGFLNSGIFPKTEETVEYFCNTYLESIKYLDLAPRWCTCILPFEYQLYNKLNPNCYNTKLEHLEPYYFDNPWTEFLKNKKVLVVSPFAKSITQQYQILDKIWNKKILKNFSLETVKFPFGIGISDEMKEFKSYQDCLQHFKDLISTKKFDFAILGCGAYALPLCQHIKQNMGKSCIQLGGATQILFGIKGARWDNIEGVKCFYNQYWRRPLPEEMPVKKDINEGGCYW